MKKGPWEKTGTTTAYEDKWLKIQVDDVVDPSGKEDVYSYIDRVPSVFMMLVNQNNEVMVQQEYKYPIDKEIYMFPAGACGRNEDPLVCGKRELSEEAGIEAAEWKRLGEIYLSASKNTEKATMFLVTGVTGQEERHLDQTEVIKGQRWIPVKEVYDMLDEGLFEEAGMVSTLAHARKHFSDLL